MIAGRTDLHGTADPIIVVVTQGNPVPTISGVGSTAYAEVPQQTNLTPIQGWAAFKVTVP